MDTALLISSSLLAISLGAIVLYAKRIREIGERYTKAKNVVNDVVLSFKRDLQRQDGQVRLISQMVREMSSKDGSKGIERLNAEAMRIKKDLEGCSAVQKDLSGRVEGLTKRVEDISLQYEESLRKISELEKMRVPEPFVLERIEAAIPIRKEKALARLTDTELTVLEILASEGEKTASQIRDRIDLTREHTARLMRSLHIRGYVERTTEKLPYVYRLKTEMMRIMKGEMKT